MSAIAVLELMTLLVLLPLVIEARRVLGVIGTRHGIAARDWLRRFRARGTIKRVCVNGHEVRCLRLIVNGEDVPVKAITYAEGCASLDVYRRIRGTDKLRVVVAGSFTPYPPDFEQSLKDGHSFECEKWMSNPPDPRCPKCNTEFPHANAEGDGP